MSANPGSLTIITADLEKVRQDITDYLFEGQEDFSAQIETANKMELRNISEQLRKEYPSYDEVQITDLISKIKDHPTEKSLFDRRVMLTLSVIFDRNGMIDEADYYRRLFYQIPLRYFIDENEDGIQDKDESRNRPGHRVTFGR